MPFQNWHEEFDKFWLEHLEPSKIFTLMGSFWKKYVLFELKMYRGVVFHDTKEWCKIWRKADLWFGKWQEKFGIFSPEDSKVSALGLWWDRFIQSIKYMSLKFMKEFCVTTMKNDANFERNWLQNWHEEFDKFWSEHLEVPNICTSMHNGLFLAKVFNFWAKKVQRCYLSWHWRVMQNLKKNWLVVWKMTWGIWQIFTRALRSLKIGTLMGSFYPK